MSGRPRIVLLVATARGLRVLRAALAAVPDADYTVVTFREGVDEPPFCDAIAEAAAAASARSPCSGPWGRPDLDCRGQSHRTSCWPRAGAIWFLGRSTNRCAAVRMCCTTLLPAYRGFAPTVWALVNGERQVGATLLTMAAGADEGDIIAQHAIPVGTTTALPR